MTRTSSPVSGVIKTPKGLYTGKEAGDATGDGSAFESETISLGEEIPDLIRERRLVFEETMPLPDEQVNLVAESVTLERLTHRETPLAFLNSTVASGPERPIQAPSSTLTAGFGRGGFGQLGVGGLLDVTG